MALVVLTGGARSGKSTAAQALALARALDGTRVVVAVFGREDASDPEFAERVKLHRLQRPLGFETLEADDSFSWTLGVDPHVLVVVDCLGTLLGRAMDEAWPADGAGLGDAAADTLPAGYETDVEERFSAVLAWLLGRVGDTVVVTNEVGEGIVPSYATGRLFRDVLGRANRRLVARADAAYLCVAGKLVDLAALPGTATWPED